MLKEGVVEAGDHGNDRRVRLRDDLNGNRVQRMDLSDTEVRSSRATYSFASATHRFKHGNPRLPHAMRLEKFGKFARRRAVPGERQDSRAGLQPPNNGLKWATVQR